MVSFFPRFIPFSAFYPFSRILSFFPRFIPFSAFYSLFRLLSLFRVLSLFPRFIPFSAFYPFFRVLSPFPRFIPFSASAIPYFRNSRSVFYPNPDRPSGFLRLLPLPPSLALSQYILLRGLLLRKTRIRLIQLLELLTALTTLAAFFKV